MGKKKKKGKGGGAIKMKSPPELEVKFKRLITKETKKKTPKQLDYISL